MILLSPRIPHEASEKAPEKYVSAFLLALAVFSILGRECFAAPIRVYTPDLWYVPDILMFVTAAQFCFNKFRHAHVGFMLALGAIMAWSLLSLLFLNHLTVLFEIRTSLAVLVGIAAATSGLMNKKIVRLILLAFLISFTSSVLYANFFGLEWDISYFDSITGTRNVSRKWWTAAGEERISGFAMMSTDAAMIISTLFLFLYPLRTSGLIKTAYMVLLFIGLYALYCTHQTATTGCFLFIISLLSMRLATHRDSHVFTGQDLLQKLTLLAFALCLLVPFILYGTSLTSLTGYTLTSIDDRTLNVWPGAIARLFSFPTILTGSGIGSTGNGAVFTSAQWATPPDNLFLYAAIQLGLPFSLFIVACLGRLVYNARKSGIDIRIPLSLLSMLLLNGLTANLLGSVTSCFWLAYGFAMLTTKQSIQTTKDTGAY